jgi:hypothetical protein
VASINGLITSSTKRQHLCKRRRFVMKIRYTVFTLAAAIALITGASGCSSGSGSASYQDTSAATDLAPPPDVASVDPAPAVTTPTLDYNDPATLDAAILARFNDPANDKPGVGPFRATAVDCVSSAPHIFDCRYSLDAATAALVGENYSIASYVVSADGTTFIAKAGQPGMP